MAPRTGAFSKRQSHLQHQHPSWTEQERTAADELSRMGLKTLSRMFQPQEAGAEPAGEVFDESGFFPDEAPLRYISPAEAGREDGEEHEVVFKRIAIRKAPDTGARCLGTAAAGEQLVLFGWDETRTWRSTHFRLRGGHGGLVEAWVMMRHPELGSLLRAPGGPVEESSASSPTCACGNVFSAEAAFCCKCGARRPDIVREVTTSSGVRGWPSESSPPRSLQAPPPAQPLQREKDIVAEGNLQVLTAVELSRLALEDLDGSDDVADDGCTPATSQELVDLLSFGADVYEVVHRPFVAVRSLPATEARIVGACPYRQTVDTFGWDDTGLWKRVFGRIAGSRRVVSGWMLVEKEGVGPLLRLVEAAGAGAW